MTRMARTVARMARWLADFADPYAITSFFHSDHKIYEMYERQDVLNL